MSVGSASQDDNERRMKLAEEIYEQLLHEAGIEDDGKRDSLAGRVSMVSQHSKASAATLGSKALKVTEQRTSGVKEQVEVQVNSELNEPPSRLLAAGPVPSPASVVPAPAPAHAQVPAPVPPAPAPLPVPISPAPRPIHVPDTPAPGPAPPPSPSLAAPAAQHATPTPKRSQSMKDEKLKWERRLQKAAEAKKQKQLIDKVESLQNEVMQLKGRMKEMRHIAYPLIAGARQPHAYVMSPQPHHFPQHPYYQKLRPVQQYAAEPVFDV
eukprot:TRINITY_DN33367_c0_g1_i1.p1 TRINITY_DN33367_c0_g1~~TRINITY_DN33367_c0_g1_i1.p1  ORF type:complete len:276 (+),score=58.11 TRINITY_DN33367_c0_g1_i1:30-830(+)